MPKPLPRLLARSGWMVAGMVASAWLGCAEKAPPPLYPDVPPPVLAEPIGKPTVVEIYGAGASSVEPPPPAVTQAGQMPAQADTVESVTHENTEASPPLIGPAPEQTPSAAPASDASVKPARVNRKKARQRSSNSRPQGQPRER